ncbi:MAG: FGGY family carbohydrate kinase, partial [Gammaproteobacteria bacterium]
MTGSSPCYLVIDQGGHASRALVFDSQGRVLAMQSRGIETRRDDKDRVEHDPDSLIASITKSIEAVIASTGVDVNQIVSAGIATQRSSIVCWDRNTGEALSPVISWQDRRTAAAMPRYSGQAGL